MPRYVKKNIYQQWTKEDIEKLHQLVKQYTGKTNRISWKQIRKQYPNQHLTQIKSQYFNTRKAYAQTLENKQKEQEQDTSNEYSQISEMTSTDFEMHSFYNNPILLEGIDFIIE